MMDESLFDRYPFTVVVSTDFIKSAARRDEFLRTTAPTWSSSTRPTPPCPTASGRTGSRTQRYDLLRRLAADPDRHLVLVTATPHSGKEEGFRNLLGLLDPALADVDLEQRRRPRAARPALRAAPPRRHPPLPRRGHRRSPATG